MEKIVYALWKGDQERARFNASMLGEVASDLLGMGARGLHFDLVDDAVAGHSAPFPQASRPPIDGALHLWVDSAVSIFRQPYDDAIQARCRAAGYLVTESQPVTSPDRAGQSPGSRSEGYVQLVFMQRPKRFRQDEWLEYWFNRHTQRAVEDHECTYYGQNVIVRPLTHAAPAYDAIVEEIYPSEALADPVRGFKPGVDIAAYQASAVAMIDPTAIDVIAAGQYIFKHPYE